jgi:hypothetical protein
VGTVEQMLSAPISKDRVQDMSGMVGILDVQERVALGMGMGEILCSGHIQRRLIHPQMIQR